MAPPDAGGALGSPGGGGGLDGIMKLLAGLQSSPPPDGEKKMLQEAVTMMSGAAARIQTRSAKAARLVMEAQAKVQGGLEALAQEGQQQFSPPPDFGMGGAGAPPGPMGGM